MARPLRDNLHSRLVRVLKIALPLIALLLLSTLFLFSRKINPEDAIPYASVDVDDRLRDPKMTGAGFSGMTADGAALTITAAEAKPQSAGGTLRQVLGALTTPDGAKTEFAAAEVALKTDKKMIEFSKGAELQSSTGYLVSTQGLGVATDRTLVESRGDVSAEGPMGQLTANHMVLSKDGETGPYLLVFNGKVRLLYQPGR